MLVADVPLGSFLWAAWTRASSALMADIAKRPINTFTLGFHGDRAISEHSHAVLASRHIGAKHNILMLDPGDMLGALDQWTKTFGEPLADPAALPTMLLARHV